ncbi:MAG: M60 family metallopeptidase, partial [Ruminococcus sp.]|nr:M60 family metallopeptidase [Ruminococcus sp.]
LQSEHGNFKLIKINPTYYVHVRCISDGYKSKWSDFAKVTTVSNSKPDKPDYVSAKGDFQSMKVSWGSDNTNSTTGYKLYYRNITNVDADGNPTDVYHEVNVGKTTSYTIYGLEDKQEYEVYVRGYNGKGDSPESVHSKAKTTSVDPIIVRKYNAINCDDKGVLGSAHIVSVTREGGDIVGNNEKDAQAAEKGEKTAWSVVDNDQETYYTHKSASDRGLIFEFDKEYDIGSFALTIPVAADLWIVNAATWNEETQKWDTVVSGYKCTGATTDKNGKKYFIKEFPHFKTKKVKIWFGNYPGHNEVTYSEIVFYQYESLMDDIMNLYADDLHTVLRDDVTQETIEELRKKIVLPDSRNGEFHPNKESLEKELNTAEKILNAEQISQPILIHNSITTYDPIAKGTSRRYSGLNAWQPLGVNAGANTEVTIYVGGKNMNNNTSMKTGDSTELKLIATQYNSESNSLSLLTKDLTIGANTITIPSGNIANAEAGGALYIQHHGGDQSKVYYSVRVEGGTEVPILDLYQITDREERLNKAADYIEALEAHVANMEAEHNRLHKGSKYMGERNSSLDYNYDEKLCITGATDILCDTMMYSLPAPQILAGLGKGSVEARAEKLIQSMNSMEEMMKLFYQHKGMSADATDVVNRIPNQHLNIRYQRMFQGAFMYAAGNHIGIQWGSAPSMVCSTGVKSDENGRYVSGSYFGWGIAHEIGHNLNDSSYVLAEITNNYFSLLSQSQDKNAGSRLNYNNIYKKVTSNTSGNADQGTQLGMYWQLHLAYDKDFNFKTYDTNEEILKNLFYARMDTYSRNPEKAPQPYGTPLTLSGGTDQQLMRLACAAAEKDVLEFFRRWGKSPDATTLTYASQFTKETRAIMYANDDSRVYAMTDESWLVNDDGSAAAVIDDVKVSVGTGAKANKVNISIDVSDEMYADDILGYEIVRCTISGGDVKETPIAFTQTPNYTDTVTAFNNRTVSYKVTLIDHYLNRSAVFSTDMVKIEHDGSLDKSNWTISTQTESNHNLSAKMITHEASEDELPCEATVINPVINAFDNDPKTVYEATVTGSPSIYINFNQPQVVCGVKITTPEEYKDNAIKECWVYTKDEAGKWALAWKDSNIKKLNDKGVIYFTNAENKYISTLETSEIRIQLLNKAGKEIVISEIDVLGPTGDNVDFRRDGEKGATAFGILSEDYKYGTKATDFIPKDSVVFIGSYKGNPAYNAVILFDENGNIVGSTGTDDDGKAQQIILADVPNGSLITDVSNGTFVYWVNPEDIDNMIWPEQVRVELYRVNKAQTNEGQRIVSDSLFETVPAKDEISSITIGGNRKYTTEVTTKVGDTE